MKEITYFFPDMNFLRLCKREKHAVYSISNGMKISNQSCCGLFVVAMELPKKTSFYDVLCQKKEQGEKNEHPNKIQGETETACG